MAACPMTRVSWTLLVMAVVAVSTVSAVTNQDQAAVPGRQKRDLPSINAKLRIVTIAHPPYTVLSQLEASHGKGYIGFIPDLIYKLSRILRFDYEFYVSPDGRYGSREANGSWNGMIGELTNRRADLAASALAMTPIRARVVEFVHPFHHMGLIALIQKEYVTNGQNLESWPFDFSVFRPLEPAVWSLALGLIVMIGLLLWGINRLNPYEWGGRYNVGKATEDQADSFSLAGSLWFAFSTFQWQGYQRAPRSYAARILTCFWFGFVTVTLVTYTGGLINHLFWASTVHGASPTQPSVRDLNDLVMGAGQDFKYGAVRGGATYRYVMDVAAQRWPEFNKISQYWRTTEGQAQLVSSTDEGLKKVRQGKYALLMETMEARYLLNSAPCDLTTIGEQFGLRAYGMALPINSAYLEPLHQGILQLIAEGEVDDLEKIWWEGPGQCWNVTQMEREYEEKSKLLLNKPKQVNLSMYWGVIVLLVIGMILSALTAAAEILFYKYKGKDTVLQERLQNIRPVAQNTDEPDM